MQTGRWLHMLVNLFWYFGIELNDFRMREVWRGISQSCDQFEYFGYSELAPINDSFGKSKLNSEIEFLMSKTAKRVEQVTAAMHMVELWFNTEAFDKNQQ